MSCEKGESSHSNTHTNTIPLPTLYNEQDSTGTTSHTLHHGLIADADNQPSLPSASRFSSTRPSTTTNPPAPPPPEVFNGVATNALQVRVDNHHNTDIVLTAVRGQFFDLAAKKERPLKKTTKLDLRQPVSAGAKSPLVLYKFFSENRVGDVGLKVWVDYTAVRCSRPDRSSGLGATPPPPSHC